MENKWVERPRLLLQKKFLENQPLPKNYVRKVKVLAWGQRVCVSGASHLGMVVVSSVGVDWCG